MSISIIMPVYNDENNIKEALDSILNQSYQDLEVICINDGSTDNSKKIIESYRNKFKKLKLINQKNQGSGIARNNGIKIAQGEYISFLDADDIYVDHDALEIMYNIAKDTNANMVSANLKGITVNGEFVNNDNLTRFKKQTTISPEEYEIPYSFYKNIFKTNFIKNNNFYFPDLKRGQDPVFLADILTHVDKIPVIPIDLYGFRYAATGGLSKINTYEKKYDYIKHFKDTLDILHDANFNKMCDRYQKKLFEFISFDKNDYDREIFDAVTDIFKNNEYDVLSKSKNIFKINNIKISVIIPVYNAENFLEESINSVLNQSLKNIELICVNDGSKDNSLEMLKNFSKKDSRVVVIDKENGGCGSARNKALDNAKGEFVYFFDPDDYILPNAFEELYNNAVANQSDLVMFKIARFRDNEPIDYSNPGFDFENIFKGVDFNNFTFNYHDIKRYVLNKSFAPWTKLYRKDFLDKYDDFRFALNITFDDVPFHVQSVLRASKISFVPDYFYHYRLSNPNSVNNTSSNAVDIIKICAIVENFLKENGYFAEFEEEFVEFKITQILNYIIFSNSRHYFNLAKNEFQKLDNSKLQIPPHLKNKFNSVIKADTYDEYKVRQGIPLLNEDSVANPLISVIIPIYNTGKYLPKCLDSILNQTFNQIEILCIDDGSTDNSLQILEEYSNKDSRIKIFSNNHNGAGAARNTGLDNAKGKYISFIDSDDWIDSNTYQELYKKMEDYNLDIIMFQLINYNDVTHKLSKSDYYDVKCLDKKFDNQVFSYRDVEDILFDIPVSPCNKLIKHDLIKRLNLRFLEGKMFEDNPFFFKLFLSSDNVSFVRKYYYYRRRHAESIMSKDELNLLDAMPITTEVLYCFKELNLFEKYACELTNFKFYFIRTYYRNIKQNYKQNFFEAMKKDFNKCASDKDIANAFENNLHLDTLAFYKNGLDAKDYHEFDLLMKLSTFEIKLMFADEEIESLKNQNKRNYEHINKLNEKNRRYKHYSDNLFNKNKNNEAMIKNLNDTIDETSKKYNELLSSNSWKITKHLRKIKNYFKNPPM